MVETRGGSGDTVQLSCRSPADHRLLTRPGSKSSTSPRTQGCYAEMSRSSVASPPATRPTSAWVAVRHRVTGQRNRFANSSSRLTGVLSARARSAEIFGLWEAQTNAVTIKSEKNAMGSSNMIGGFTFSAGGEGSTSGVCRTFRPFTHCCTYPNHLTVTTSQPTGPFVAGFRQRRSRELGPSHSWSHPWLT